MVGKRIGKLVVLRPGEDIGPNGLRKWVVRCDCGTVKEVRAHPLRKHLCLSCGGPDCRVYRNSEPLWATWQDCTQTLPAWSEQLGLDLDVLRGRFKAGMRDELLFAPVCRG